MINVWSQIRVYGWEKYKKSINVRCTFIWNPKVVHLPENSILKKGVLIHTDIMFVFFQNKYSKNFSISLFLLNKIGSKFSYLSVCKWNKPLSDQIEVKQIVVNKILRQDKVLKRVGSKMNLKYDNPSLYTLLISVKMTIR